MNDDFLKEILSKIPSHLVPIKECKCGNAVFGKKDMEDKLSLIYGQGEDTSSYDYSPHPWHGSKMEICGTCEIKEMRQLELQKIVEYNHLLQDYKQRVAEGLVGGNRPSKKKEIFSKDMTGKEGYRKGEKNDGFRW